MEKLAKQQKLNAAEVISIVENYHKDSPTRKTLEYYQERLKRLEAAWKTFDAADNSIRNLPEVPPDHLYFKNELYENISEKYQEYQEHFLSKIASLSGTPPQAEVVAGKDNNQDETSPDTLQTVESNKQGEATASYVDSRIHDGSKSLQKRGLEQAKGVPIEQSSETKSQDRTPPEETPTQRVIKLIRRQRAVAQSICRLFSGIKRDDQQLPKTYYDLKIKTINQYWSQMEDHNQSLWELIEDPTKMGYDFNEYIQLEEEVQEHLVYLTSARDKGSSTVSDTKTPNTMMKLPKIVIPTFDGDYLKWRQFYDLFNEMVHKQVMADCQKMWYLKTNLSGEAERLIRHLSLSDDNYSTAWDMLKDRYENSRLLVTALLNKLLSQPSVSSESSTAIKSLHDTTQECLLGLENLGVSVTSWDPILLHLLIKKLDRNTHGLYEQSLHQPRKLQPIKEFLSFLETRFQSLEALGTKGRILEAHQMKQCSARSFASVTTTATACVSCKGNHPLFACRDFLNLTPPNRLNLLKRNNLCINCLRPGHSALNCTLRGCRKCTRRHNTLVHFDTSSNLPQMTSKHFRTSDSAPPGTKKLSDQQVTLAAQTIQPRRGYVILSTVLVNLVNDKGLSVECRAILDSGSQINLITERAIKRLGLTQIPDLMQIQGIGQAKQQTQRRINVLLKSKITGFSTRLEAFVLPRIIDPQPMQKLDTTSWAIPKNIQLADPNFNRPDRIDLLLGAEFYHQLLSVGQIKLGDNLPMLQNTVLGWIVGGKASNVSQERATCGICSEDEGFDKGIERFWKLEEVEKIGNSLTSAERRCESHFYQTVKRNLNGRFIVRLPFTEDPNRLGESKDIALSRFSSLERKLSKNNELKLRYIEFMNEYRKLGHMQEIDVQTIQRPYYFLPHHSVLKPDSSTTKLRVVFDASAKTSSNISLNDILATGPTIQDDLLSILLRFRIPRFVFTADIEKMYRQILLDDEDRKYQLILWRNDTNDPLKCYQLNTVTYGTTTAPYLAIKCLKQLAKEEVKRYPLGSQALQNDFYVDDVMTGSDSIVTALDTQTQLIALLHSAGFKLRKWCANHPRLLQNIPCEDIERQLDFNDDSEEHVKTLGLTWLPKTDMFRVKTNWTEIRRITKRTVTSDIAHLFDPLGLMAPVVVIAKMFLQQLWAYKLEWDAALPLEFHTRWTRFREGLKTLNDITVPRHVFSHESPKSVQIHAFADASEKAYGAAVYIRSINSNNCIVVRLLCAKSRIAPTKQITLPRLELCAAKLAAELTNRVKSDLKMQDTVTFLWTDSEIVLAWINSTSSSFQTFVANRVSTIQELTIPQQWRHVNSKENPADMLSRGIAPEKLENCTLWFYGPPFLHGQESVWPQPYSKKAQCQLERKRTAMPITANNDGKHFIQRIDHKNSFRKLQRITAYMLRYLNLTRNQGPRMTGSPSLTPQELNEGLFAIMKSIQEEGFKDDLSQLKQYKELSKTSALLSLSPFIDERGIIRVGGRLESTVLSYDAKHPMLLPCSHPLTKLLMTDIHRENLHVGPQSLLAITRQNFWPIKGKTVARSIVQHCIQCAKSRPKMLSQMMGNLPPTRVQPARPFMNSGVDFCGPIWTHFRIRGKRPQKSYIAVFCCFATKAVHLEVVSDLTTIAFIGALKRFMGRRGHCKTLYCDNATNFVGAKNQLIELSEAVYSDKSREAIESICSSKGIDFHFIPPRAPHFGGLWEAAVKSAKHLLQRSVGSASLTYEELETVIIEIEAILNSRPLTQMSSDPNDFTALTPGHFLIGEPLTASVDPTSEELKAGLPTRWKLISQIKQEFWQRWSTEYLNTLQHRTKWKQRCDNVQPGTIVIIKEDNVPVLKWPLGRIIKTFKGDDGLVRVADVRTSTTTLRRAIHRLAPLPIEDGNDDMNITVGEHSNQEKIHHTDLGITDHDHKGDNQLKTHKKHSSTKGESTSRNDNVPRKRMRRSYSSAIVTLLLTCLCWSSSEGKPVEITPFTQQLGIHFENMGTANIISKEWNLVVYYDMVPYWMEFEALVNGTNSLEHLCKQINQKSACTKVVTQFHHLREELKKDNDLLSSNPTTHRDKRGALDIVGNVANTLFGVLDSEYAADMSNTINDIKENEDHLLTLLKNQTSIIDSTINIMKIDQETVERKFQELDDHLNAINSRIHNTTEGLYQHKLSLLFNSLSIQVTLIASNFQRIQAAIVDTIIDTHHGRISPQLLAPQQFRQELMTIKAHLPSNLRLPIDTDNIVQLYTLMTIEGRAVNNHVIFRLKLPLVNLDNFDLFRIVPIPQLINGTFFAIKPSSTFLAINLHRDQYYPLTDEQQSKCVKLEETTYLCRQLHPIYRRGADISACEVNLLSHMQFSEICEVSKVQKGPIWIQLLHSNQWIYALKEKISINAVCGERALSITLEGSGLLEIQPDCIIKQDLVTIQGHHIYPSSTRLS